MPKRTLDTDAAGLMELHRQALRSQSVEGIERHVPSGQAASQGTACEHFILWP